MRDISIFGVSSDSGKSFITMLLCNLLFKRGFRVSPFKAQNMSNNSRVADDGSEIGVAQYIQAKYMNIQTSYRINPILLKPQSNQTSQIVIEGVAKYVKNARQYYKDIDTLAPVIDRAFNSLKEQNDILICEGAGSPVELNLIDKDLSNSYVAKNFNTKIILVADIERGGVFASIYGTYALLDEQIKKNVIGVIINKFRGDISLFDEGKRIIEQDFGLKVLGIMPYFDFSFGFEDSLSLKNYKKRKAKIKVAMIKFPKISNFNDIEPLVLDESIELDFIDYFTPLAKYDLVILSGTKNTISDLIWLKKIGLFEELKEYKKLIFGICGGYQMLFNKIVDSQKVESEIESIEGFGFIDDSIYFEKEKTLDSKEYFAFGKKLKGFEIHNGVSKKYPIFYENGNILGTHLHGVFENNSFREFLFKKIDKNYIGFDFQKLERKSIDSILVQSREILDLDYIIKELSC